MRWRGKRWERVKERHTPNRVVTLWSTPSLSQTIGTHAHCPRGDLRTGTWNLSMWPQQLKHCYCRTIGWLSVSFFCASQFLVGTSSLVTFTCISLPNWNANDLRVGAWSYSSLCSQGLTFCLALLNGSWSPKVFSNWQSYEHKLELTSFVWHSSLWWFWPLLSTQIYLPRPWRKKE